MGVGETGIGKVAPTPLYIHLHFSVMPPCLPSISWHAIPTSFYIFLYLASVVLFHF